MWHLLMAHQQESFLPFSSRQSLSCRLSRVAKRSTAKPRGPLPFPSEPHGPLFTSPKLPDPLPSPPKPCGPLFPFIRTAWTSVYLLASEPRGSLSSMAAAPRFKSQCPSSFAAPFPTPPAVSYTCQHPRILPAQRAAIVSLGRCGPMAWSQSSPRSHAGPVTRGSYFPVPSWVEFGPIPLAQSMATAT